MKTIEEILEGVTARGQWQADELGRLMEPDSDCLIDSVGGTFWRAIDAAFAARATSNFEGLCRVLEAIRHKAQARDLSSMQAIEKLATQTLAEALKD